MKHDRVNFINFLARVFGVAATLAGVVFLVAAYAIVEKRILNIVIGLISLFMGIAFLVTKSVNAKQIARIRRRLGRPKSQ